MGKKLKRFSSGLLVLIMVISMTVTSSAQSFSVRNLSENLEKMDLRYSLGDAVVLMLDSQNAYVDLTKIAIDDSNNQIKPLLKNGKTLVPVRFISEALGAEVDWDGKTSTITISLEDRVAKLVLGSKEMSINGKSIQIDEPAQLIDNRTFVPLRAIAEALGKKVFYDRGLIIISDTEKVFDTSSEKAYIDAVISLFQDTVPEGYDYDYYYTISVLLSYSGLDKEAIKYADKLIEMKPYPIDYYMTLEHTYEVKAQLLENIDSYEEAITYYDKAIAIDPNNAYFYFLKGRALYTMEQYEDSIKVFDKAIELFPDFAPAYGGKAAALGELGEYNKAVKVYHELIKLDIDAGVVYQCAVELWKLGLYKEAIELFDKAATNNNGSVEFYEAKGEFLLYSGEYEKAIKVADEILKKDKNNIAANKYKYLSLWSLGKYDEALIIVDKLIKTMPESSEFYYSKGKLLYGQEKYELALKEFDKVIKLEPDVGYAYKDKALTLFEIGELDKAIEEMHKAIELEPYDPEFYYSMTWLLMHSEQYEEALEYVNTGLQISIKLEQLNPMMLNIRGWAHYKLGDYDSAAKDFELALGLDNSIGGSNYGMACIYAIKNQNEKALEYLTIALELDPSYIQNAMLEYIFRGIRNTDEFKALVKKYTRYELGA